MHFLRVYGFLFLWSKLEKLLVSETDTTERNLQNIFERKIVNYENLLNRYFWFRHFRNKIQMSRYTVVTLSKVLLIIGKVNYSRIFDLSK